MSSEKVRIIQPILESTNGVHLTVYLNRDNPISIKQELKDIRSETEESLSTVFSSEELRQFLDPVEALIRDDQILSKMPANIGIFRKRDSFRILNIPITLETQLHVADSFHVKPLLKWLQVDREFYLLGIHDGYAHLYIGDQTCIRKIGSIHQNSEFKTRESIMWLNSWVKELAQPCSPRLFVAAPPQITNLLMNKIRYRNLMPRPIDSEFFESKLSDICKKIRSYQLQEGKNHLERSFLEYRFAEEFKFAKKNIFQIARAAVQGRIKKLIVAEELNIFGKIDTATGGLALHPYDLNHEDDDILDDLAQTVLAHGGEVLVAPRDQIPKGRPALAILEPQDPDLTTLVTKKEAHNDSNQI